MLPDLALNIGKARPVERVQNETIRLILKLLNLKILHVVAERLDWYDVAFVDMDRKGQRARLRTLVQTADSLNQPLLGAVLGQLTEDEMDVYLLHQVQVRRGCLPVLFFRVQVQIGAIAVRVRTG